MEVLGEIRAGIHPCEHPDVGPVLAERVAGAMDRVIEIAGGRGRLRLRRFRHRSLASTVEWAVRALSYPAVTMTQTSSRRLRAPERRQVVLDAAGRLFGERGYEGTSLNEVAAAAGVTKPILYRHFDSKRALYLALLERHRADLDSFAPLIP